MVSSIIGNYFAFPDIGKPQAVAPEAFRFSYEGGGDSEFINYLKYILQGKCVQSVYEF